MNAGGILVNAEGRKLSRMASPATPKEVNNNLDASEDEKEDEADCEKVREIICEIAPQVTYAGEGLEPLVKDCKIKVPATQIGL